MKHNKMEHNRKRRGKGISLLLLLALLVFPMLYFTGIFGGEDFGFGSGIVNESDNMNSTTGAEVVSNIIAIRIEETEIYFGDELCDSTDVLKQKITETSSSKEYELIHDNAIKSVYDEVIGVLSELETALDITVDYN